MNRARREYLEMLSPKAVVAEIEQLEWRLGRMAEALDAAIVEARACKRLAASFFRQCQEAKHTIGPQPQ